MIAHLETRLLADLDKSQHESPIVIKGVLSAGADEAKKPDGRKRSKITRSKFLFFSVCNFNLNRFHTHSENDAKPSGSFLGWFPFLLRYIRRILYGQIDSIPFSRTSGALPLLLRLCWNIFKNPSITCTLPITWPFLERTIALRPPKPILQVGWLK